MEGRQTNDDRRWTDEQTQSRRQTDREKTDRLTVNRQRKEAERAILTVIEVFIWIEGDLDT